jgi:hypothetical protein
MNLPNRKRITTSTTTTLMDTSCVISQIVISVADPGTSWTLKIQDKASPAFVLLPAIALASPSTPDAAIIKFQDPIFMEGGIDIITAGTAGQVAVWISGLS